MMKKIFHYLVVALGILIVVGVVLVVLNSGSHKSDNSTQSGIVVEEHLSSVESSLHLGSSRGGDPRREFGLGEKIYATVSLKDLEEGDYTLTFRWIKPGGGVQETFRKKFHSPGGNYRGWSWLELTGDELISFSIGPFGSGKFLGGWKVRVYLNSLLLNSEEFTVK
jgi:hypothetical protein